MSRTLFPSAWPWRAWPAFEQDLLAAVYGRSEDLWPELRDRCRRVTSWLEHVEYEGELERENSFAGAAKLVPAWPDAEPVLQQARTLLGRHAWETLTARAAMKAGEAVGETQN